MLQFIILKWHLCENIFEISLIFTPVTPMDVLLNGLSISAKGELHVGKNELGV